MSKKTLWSLGLVSLAVGAFALVSLFALAHEDGKVALDGVIGADEYDFHYFDEDIQMDVYWTLTDDDLYVGLKAPAAGWVSMGVREGVPPEEEENAMEGVDLIIGFVKDGQLSIRDHFADTPFGHTPDTELGGEDNVLGAAGSEADGFTVIEYERPIDTGDAFDHPIAQGEVEVYLAYADADDFTTIHTERTEVILNFVTGQAEKEEE